MMTRHATSKLAEASATRRNANSTWIGWHEVLELSSIVTRYVAVSLYRTRVFCTYEISREDSNGSGRRVSARSQNWSPKISAITRRIFVRNHHSMERIRVLIQ